MRAMNQPKAICPSFMPCYTHEKKESNLQNPVSLCSCARSRAQGAVEVLEYKDRQASGGRNAQASNKNVGTNAPNRGRGGRARGGAAGNAAAAATNGNGQAVATNGNKADAT